MEQLTDRERELVALGAAVGSNCIPCVEHHITEIRRTGMGDALIVEAIDLADKVKQVPARNVLKAALKAGGAESSAAPSGSAPCSGLARGGVTCC